MGTESRPYIWCRSPALLHEQGMLTSRGVHPGSLGDDPSVGKQERTYCVRHTAQGGARSTLAAGSPACLRPAPGCAERQPQATQLSVPSPHASAQRLHLCAVALWDPISHRTRIRSPRIADILISGFSGVARAPDIS